MTQARSNGPVLDDEILADSEVMEAIESEGSVHRSYDIVNTDRACLGRVGGAIAKRHGDSGFAGQVAIDLQVGPWTVITFTHPLPPYSGPLDDSKYWMSSSWGGPMTSGTVGGHSTCTHQEEVMS